MSEDSSPTSSWTAPEKLYPLLGAVITGVLILIYFIQYLICRSMMLDESMLAFNIIRRGPLELLEPLDMAQGAPPLFLLLTDFLSQAFGHGEYVLRLIPLLSGCASVIFFYLSARILFPGKLAYSLLSICLRQLLSNSILHGNVSTIRR